MQCLLTQANTETPYIANTKALHQLGKILERNGYLTTAPRDFDFISTPWTDWEDKYHTLTVVERDTEADGLMTALAGFTLRALSSGTVRPTGNGGYTIQVNAIAVFVHDKFHFEEDPFPTTNNLGWWSCEKSTGALIRAPEGQEDMYFHLHNQTFRAFRKDIGNGSDFFVLSQPHLVDTFTGISYEYA